MGWGSGYNDQGREVGYAVDAECDQDGCSAQIDRGLAYVCGGMHDGGDHGCGGYFCGDHQLIGPSGSHAFFCGQCIDRAEAEFVAGDEDDGGDE